MLKTNSKIKKVPINVILPVRKLIFFASIVGCMTCTLISGSFVFASNLLYVEKYDKTRLNEETYDSKQQQDHIWLLAQTSVVIPDNKDIQVADKSFSTDIKNDDDLAKETFFEGQKKYFGWIDENEKNVCEAVNLFRQAAVYGHIEAQVFLGTCYYFGWGIEKDFGLAREWFLHAAEHDSGEAYFMLGRCCELGLGMAKDMKEALILYRKAAELGSRDAYYRLGYYFSTGEGIEQDAEEGEMWYRKANENTLGNELKLRECPDTEECLETDLTNMLNWYLDAAKLRIPEAWHLVGLCYASGRGVKKDFAEAFKWYQMAAEQGHKQSQYSLATMYRKGQGVTVDIDKAVEWYRKAAEQGDTKAQSTLGLMFDKGEDVPVNKKEAIKYYCMAAEGGESILAIVVGDYYFEGLGVEKNPQEGIKWYLKAKETDSMFLNAEDCLSQAKITEDKKMVLRFYRRAAALGSLEAQKYLADKLHVGNDLEKDLNESFMWCRMAAEQGDAGAQYNLGVMYRNGKGVPQDDREAVKWYRKAAEQGDADAQHNLGVMYSHGIGVSQDDREAVKWYRKAAEQGDAGAQVKLGIMYDIGIGVPQDNREAMTWYLRAAEQGDAYGQYFLGMMYFNGKGVPQDYVVAYSWLNLAAAHDSEAAEKRNGLVQIMTSEQIAQAQRLSASFVPKKQTLAENDTSGEATSDTKTFSENVPKANATAFAISSSGYLLTSAHVVQGAHRIEVYGNGNNYSVQVIKADTANDVALLKAEGVFTPLAVTSSGGTTLGTEVFTIGFPNVVVQGIAPKLTKGEISSLAGVQDDPRYFQISTPVQPGNSGGPLVDMYGNVIGIIAAIMNQEVALETTGTLAQNVNYAIKSSYIIPLLESVPGLSGELAANARNAALSSEEAIARAEKATFLLVTY